MTTTNTFTPPNPEPASPPTTTEVAAPDVSKLTPEKLEPIVVAESASPKQRKQRAPKHDFKDGRGRVFAHRHVNGNGWVADTACVDDSCYVGSRAQVSQYARVFNQVRIEAKAHVSGYAVVSDSAKLRGEAFVSGKARIVDSTLSDRVVIHSGADIYDSIIDGVCRVSGDCLIRGSQLGGRVFVTGVPLIAASTIRGIIDINNNSTLMRSGVYGIARIIQNAVLLDSHINNFYYNTSSIPIDKLSNVTVNPRLVVIVDEFASLQNRCSIETPMHIRGRSMLFECQFRITENSLTELHRHILSTDGAPPDAGQSDIGASYQRPDVYNKTWRNARMFNRGDFDRLVAAPENAAGSNAVNRINRDDYVSPYSLERLSNGRRLMPV